MSQERQQPGTHVGKPGQALHVTVRGPGSKNSLAITLGYDRTALYDAASFRAGFSVFNGNIPANGTNEFGFIPAAGIIDPLTIDGQRLYDYRMFAPDSVSILFPIPDMQGSVRSQDGLVLTIIAYRAGTANLGEIFTPVLNVAIQTISGYQT